MIRAAIQRVQHRWHEWRDQRFLRRHDCETWKQYHRMYDPDVVRGSTRIQDWYRGYSHFHCFDSYDHPAYDIIYDYGPGGVRWGYDVMHDWCEANCQGKWRMDIHEVSKDSWSQEWESTIFGNNWIFFAFQDQQDYMMFVLRWS